MKKEHMDRVGEVYEGLAMSKAFQDKTKGRIAWICKQANGPRILDIGCSQGIVDVLLAREGNEVLGLDIEEESIQYAKERIKQEDRSVQDKVSYVCADFMTYDFGQNKYDGILCTEVLEHVENPESLLIKASTLLNPEGEILVMVPFGINAHPDHKRTYYYLELLHSVETAFTPVEAGFIFNWVAIRAKRKEDQKDNTIMTDEAFLSEMEKSFSFVDSGKQTRINGLTKRIEKTLKDQDRLKSTIEITKQQCNDLKNDLDKAQKDRKEALLKYNELAGSFLGKTQLKLKKLKRKAAGFVHNHSSLNNIYMALRGKKKAGKAVNAAEQKAPVKKPGTGIVNPPGWSQIPQKEFEAQSDKNFYSEILPILKDIPESNGGRYYVPYNTKIGIISDTFLFDSIKDAAEFIFLGPETWKEQIGDIQILLIVSTWGGLNEEWRGAAVPGSEQQKKILDIIHKCEKKGIPTVFYSKEDPPNYECFLPLAKECKYIFTSCTEVEGKYREDCSNDRVDTLLFGINPLFHNPVGMRNKHRKEDVIFSGSWMNKYPHRCVDMRILLDGVIDSGRRLKIVDRNYNRTPGSYRYPPKYWHYISPAIDHEDLQKVHKLYDWALNINTIKDSVSMFANRGYELQASGNALISNYSVGVNDKLPFVYLANTKKEVEAIIRRADSEQIYRRQTDGIRDIMTGSTCYDRIGTILRTTGMDCAQPERKVAVIADKDTGRIHEMFRRQTYKGTKLLFEETVCTDDLTGYDIIAFFSDEMDYEIFYLEDMVNAFKYTACDYITKAAYMKGDRLVSGPEHDYVDCMESKYRTVFWKDSVDLQNILDSAEPIALPNGYSIDHFNYNAEKKEEDREGTVSGKKLSVIVPVYNNGRYLMGKCFASLMRSSLFKDMHIILVDDGSTDGITRDIVGYLSRTYDNVSAYYYPEGGSGSASRPRNKGVELSSTEYITFLDPDNEAVNDAYAKMYEIAEAAQDGQPLDLVIGGLIKYTDKVWDAKYYRKLGADTWEDNIFSGDMKELLVNCDFLAVSIQGMLIRKEMIEAHHLKQVEGAVGQDTLFSWELIANSQRIKVIDLVAHIYYAAVLSSVTNSIGKKYCQKISLMEKAKREFLIKENLLDPYMETRFNRYYSEWILRIQKRCKPEEAEECVRIIYEAYKQYAEQYNHKDEIVNEFVKKCEEGLFAEALDDLSAANQIKKEIKPDEKSHACVRNEA